MGPGDMSKRTHLWLRLTALAVIAAAAYLPRSASNPSKPVAPVAAVTASPDTAAIQSVAQR